MPQLDVLIYFTQIVWFFSGFFIVYWFISYFIIPRLNLYYFIKTNIDDVIKKVDYSINIDYLVPVLNETRMMEYRLINAWVYKYLDFGLNSRVRDLGNAHYKNEGLVELDLELSLFEFYFYGDINLSNLSIVRASPSNLVRILKLNVSSRDYITLIFMILNFLNNLIFCLKSLKIIL